MNQMYEIWFLNFFEFENFVETCRNQDTQDTYFFFLFFFFVSKEGECLSRRELKNFKKFWFLEFFKFKIKLNWFVLYLNFKSFELAKIAKFQGSRNFIEF